jgi:hypothetical protein
MTVYTDFDYAAIEFVFQHFIEAGVIHIASTASKWPALIALTIAFAAFT